MSSSGLLSHVISGARWIAISKIVSQVFMWIVTIYVMRLLQPEDYGLVAMSGILTILAGMLLDAGLGAAFVQRRDVNAAVYAAGNTMLLGGALLAIVIAQLLASPVATFFSEPVLEPVLRVASIQFIFGALAVVPVAQLSNQMRFRELALAQAASGVGSSIITLLLAMSGAGVWSLVVGVLAAALIRMLAAMWYAGFLTGFSTKLSVLRSYARFSLNLLAQRLAWFWVEELDQLIVGRVLGAGATGTYSVARNLSHIPLDRTAEVVNQVALPSFSSIQDDPERCKSALRKLISVSSVLSFPIFWGMGAVAPEAVPFLLGEKWADVVVPFMIFCLILPLRTAHALTSTVLLALGRADLSLHNVLVWAGVLSPLFLIGANYGLAGVAAAWAVGFPIVYLISAYLLKRGLHIPAAVLLTPMAAPAASAALCVAAVFACELFLAASIPVVALLAVQVISGGVAYVVALRVLSLRQFRDAEDVCYRLIGRRSAAQAEPAL
jgi:teichuronic acid exporter